MATQEAFSTLEVVDPHFEKEVVTENGIETVNSDIGKQVVTESGIEAVDLPLSPVQSHYQLNPDKRRPLRSRNLFWIIVSVSLAGAIVAAALGGILGSRKGRFRSQPQNAMPSPTPSSDPSPQPTTNPRSDLMHRKIAALSYPVGVTNVTRLYYQDSNGSFVEGMCDTNNQIKAWNLTLIGNFENNYRLNSALAAAVSRPGFPLEVRIIFTDSDFLIHDLIFNSTTSQWSKGNLYEQRYITHPNSSITALYNQCHYCANTTLVVYQDTNGFVQVANLTSSGWVQTQVNVKAMVGTGLTMHSQYKATPSQAGMFDFADVINLYYQQDILNLTLACWEPSEKTGGISGWVTENEIYGREFPATPLAVGASITNTSSVPSWIQLLRLSERGIGVSSWDDTRGGWIQPPVYTPSAMSNSTANVKTYGAVAMTALGDAFAVVSVPGESGNVSVESWSMNDDLTDWTSTGTVVKWSD